MTRIGIVDYGMGNRRSVQKAFERLDAEIVLTSDAGALEACDGLVIPGVGAFPRAMESLGRLGLIEPLRAYARDQRPVLGICLGMHLLFDSSEEIQPTGGLGLIPGTVRWLDTRGERLPHIGWNEVRFERSDPLLEGLPETGCAFYHVHSLAPHPADPEATLGTTEYGERFTTIVSLGSIAGVQFHPEKSSAHGLRLLANFAEQCAAGVAPAVGLAPPA